MHSYIIKKHIRAGIYELTDRMGMHMTLFIGKREALLFDTGYGLDDLPSFIKKMTDLPLTVVNSHGHHDHAGGNYLFDQVLIHRKDMTICSEYIIKSRAPILRQAHEKGVSLDDINEEEYLAQGMGALSPLEDQVFDLGKMVLEVILLPGHTPGSVGLYARDEGILFPGDTFNPTTWLFFEECEPFATYYQTLKRLSQLDFTYLLCPHQSGLVPRELFNLFFDCLNEKTLSDAKRERALSSVIPVFSCHPTQGTTFVFDASKLPQSFTPPKE